MSFLGTFERPLGRTGLTGALALVVGLLAAAPASAATGASVAGSNLKYLAAKGSANVVSLSFDEGDDTYTLVDDGVASVTPGKGCVRPISAPDNEVACTATGKPITKFTISTGDLSDIVDVTAPLAGTVSLGAGNDMATTGEKSQKLVGAAGSDTLDGGAGSDRISGGGGTGLDFVSYLSHEQAVSITLRDKTPNEGNSEDLDPQTGRLDVVASNIEGAIGSQAADTFEGATTGTDIFNGGPGDDIIDGRSGSDRLSGGIDNDTVTTTDTQGGAASGDTLDGGPGDDTVVSSIADDEVSGGPGFDWLDSGAGNDRVRSNEFGPAMLDEYISCGAGPDDDLFFDPADAPFNNPASGCENRVPVFDT